jgi:hypothetical protein
VKLFSKNEWSSAFAGFFPAAKTIFIRMRGLEQPSGA